MKFYHAAHVYFGITKESSLNGYYTAVLFLKKLHEYSQNWTNPHIIALFLELTSEMLNFTPSYVTHVHQKQFAYYTLKLQWSQELEDYRKSIWCYILEIAKHDNKEEQFEELLKSYPGHSDDYDSKLLISEIGYLV